MLAAQIHFNKPSIAQSAQAAQEAVTNRRKFLRSSQSPTGYLVPNRLRSSHADTVAPPGIFCATLRREPRKYFFLRRPRNVLTQSTQ
jgi:hypothetical protein